MMMMIMIKYGKNLISPNSESIMNGIIDNSSSRISARVKKVLDEHLQNENVINDDDQKSSQAPIQSNNNETVDEYVAKNFP